MNIKHHWPIELHTASHHQLWIIASYRHSLIHKLNSSSRHKMNVKKCFVSKCKYYIFVLSVLYLLQIYGVEHVCSYMPIWFLHLWTLPSILTNSNVCRTLLNVSSALVLNASYSCGKSKSRWICNRFGPISKKYSLP